MPHSRVTKTAEVKKPITKITIVLYRFYWDIAREERSLILFGLFVVLIKFKQIYCGHVLLVYH